MSDYITNTAELTAIADAIRTKGGTTASLVYPDGFVSAIEDIESGGGGASNFVHGTFTTGSTTGATSIEIPYTGSGYPVMAVVVVAGGVYNPAYSHWYDKKQQGAVGEWTMTKSVMSSTPTYATSGTQNQGVATILYKDNNFETTSYSRTGVIDANAFTSRNASSGRDTCVCFKSNKTLSYYVDTSFYGLLADTDYEYFIAYSE